MKSLFKYKNRINDKITSLDKERMILATKCKLFKKYSTAQIADFVIRKNQLNHDIELLKTLLK